MQRCGSVSNLRLCVWAGHEPVKCYCVQVLGISVDSQFSHLAWCQTGGCSKLLSAFEVEHSCICRYKNFADAADRKEGGVGELKYPLVSDLKREISKKYNVLTEDGVALRGLFIIDKEVCSCLHRLPVMVSRSVLCMVPAQLRAHQKWLSWQ